MHFIIRFYHTFEWIHVIRYYEFERFIKRCLTNECMCSNMCVLPACDDETAD